MAELEAELAVTRRELERAREQHRDDNAGFAQTLARLTQSERSLSQTRAKLVDAETRATAAEARVSSLQAHLAAAEAQVNDLETKLAEAEAREREALISAEDARDERAAMRAELTQVQAELADAQRTAPEGPAELAPRSNADDAAELRRRLAAAEARVDTLTHERVRLLDLMSSLEVLGREITQLTQQSVPEVKGLPKVEAWLGRDVEAEHVRATLRPEGFSAPPPQASRSWSTPEIVIDGVKLEPQ